MHLRQGCWHAGELAFACYEFIAGDEVPDDKFDVRCRRCWPEKLEMLENVDAEKEEDSMDGTDSSNTDGTL